MLTLSASTAPHTTKGNERLSQGSLISGLFRAKRHEKDTRIPTELCERGGGQYANELDFDSSALRF